MENGKIVLSVIDLLGLADTCKVAMVDLSTVGYSGILFVRDLTTAQQQKVLSGPRQGKTRIYKDQSMDVNWSDLGSEAGSKFLEACLVTDKEGGAGLMRAFEGLEPGEDGVEEKGPRYILYPTSELVLVHTQALAELKKASVVREKFDAFPNAITSLIIKTVRELSGMGEDVVTEKKES